MMDEHASGESRGNDPGMDHLNRFQSVVRKQDDRGMALSLTAFAEDTLGRLFVIYLREKKQAKELVEGFNAPLDMGSTDGERSASTHST